MRNPVLDRELKERLRTRRATIVITIYLAILAVILYTLYRSQASSTPDVFGGPIASQAATVGRTMFETLVLVMLALVLFIVPGLTADALTGERERQTLVPLQVTLLRPRAIVTGKLLASLAFVSLLVVATLPMLGISFILGGVSVGQVVKAVGAVLATGVVVASLSLLCSSLARRTQGAMVLAYGLALFLAIGAPLIYLGQCAVDDAGPHPAPTILVLNPFVATADAVTPGDQDRIGTTSPLQGMSELVRQLEDPSEQMTVRFEQQGGFAAAPGIATTVVGGNADVFVNGEVLEDGAPQVVASRTGLTRIPFWVRSAAVLGASSLVGLLIATRRITTPSDRTTA